MKRFFHATTAVALGLLCMVGTAIGVGAVSPSVNGVSVPLPCTSDANTLNTLQERLNQLCGDNACIALNGNTAALQEQLNALCGDNACIALNGDTAALQEQLNALCGDKDCSAAEWLNHLIRLSQTPSAQVSRPDVTPSQPTQPSEPDVTPSTSSSYEQQVIDLINEIRIQNGLSPLTENAALSRCAKAKSQDMHDKGYFSHQSPTYGSPFEMMKQFGITYRAAGENIAMGQTTPQAVVHAWMNSEGHRANILNASFTQIGMGYVADGHYWTQQFIG